MPQIIGQREAIHEPEMQSGRTEHFSPHTALGGAISGLLLCLWHIAAPDTVPCPTSGCAAAKHITLFGLSLWVFGAAAFAALTACALLKRIRTGRIVASAALVADIALLGMMAIGAPCLTCLIGAAAFAAAYAGFMRLRSFAYTLPAAIWGVLFVMNIGITINAAVKPWAVLSPEKPTGQVYFSPSCGACLRLVGNTSLQDVHRTAWCPVAKDKTDAEAVAVMTEAVKNGAGLREAVFKAAEYAAAAQAETKNPPPAHAPSAFTASKPKVGLGLRVKLWINKTRALRGGLTMLPYRELYGASVMAPKSQPGGSKTRPGKTHTEDHPAYLHDAGMTEPEICGGNTDPCK